MASPSVGDIEGPWADPNWESGLIARLRGSWSIPIDELSNEMLATFLRQNIATAAVLEEAMTRLESGLDDHSELFDGELVEAVKTAKGRR